MQRDPSVGSRLLAGSLLACGVLVKPVPILLLPLLLVKFRDRDSISKWVRVASPIVIGLVVTVAGAFTWFALERINLSENLHRVLTYGAANQKTVPLGLARISTLNHFGNATNPLRDVAFLLALAVVVRYHVTRRHTDPIATAGAVLLIVPAVGGLDYQYLLWALPFIIATGRLRLAVLYGSICSIIVVLYGVSPGLWLFGRGQEGNFLLPIRRLRFLAIPHGAEGWLSSGTPPALWRASNLLLPILMLGIAVALLRLPSVQNTSPAIDGHAVSRRAVSVDVGIAITLVVAAMFYLLGPYPSVSRRVLSHFQAQLHGYALLGLPYHPRVESGTWWGSALVLLPLFIVAWSVLVWRRGRDALAHLT